MKKGPILVLWLIFALVVTSCEDESIVSPYDDASSKRLRFVAPYLFSAMITGDSMLSLSWSDRSEYGADTPVTYLIEQSEQSAGFMNIASVPRTGYNTGRWSIRMAPDTTKRYRFRMRTARGSDTSAWSRVLLVSYGPILAIGGNFNEVVGGPYCPGVAQYNGSEVFPGAHGVGFRCAIAIHEGKLWAGQNGSIGGVGAYAVYKDDLHAGVRWCSLAPSERLYRLSNEGWSPVGGMVEAHVTSLVVFHDELYVGGSLGSVGGKPAVNIASWNGVRWSTTASSLSSGVTALAVHNDQLHAATKNMVYVWNGNSWTQVGDRLYGDVNLLVSHGGRLYAGGSMSLSWNGTRYGLAVFEQHTWTLIERSMNAELTAAAVYQGEVYFARRQDNTVSVAASPDLGTVITVRESSTGWSIGAHLFALATGSMWNCREEPAATPSRPELVD